MRYVALMLIVACANKHEAGSSAQPTQAKHVTSSADAGTARPADAAAVSDAAIDGANVVIDYFESQLCLDVMTKLKECITNKDFIAAVDGKEKPNAKLRKDFESKVLNLQDAEMRCDFAGRVNFQREGFLEHWPVLAGIPDALASCASLGSAIAKAGGLAGGAMAN